MYFTVYLYKHTDIYSANNVAWNTHVSNRYWGEKKHIHIIFQTHTHIYILHTNIANTNEYQPDKT